MRDASQSDVIVIGMGQLGSLLHQGLELGGARAVAVTRQTDREALFKRDPTPNLVVAAVGERDLGPLVASLPRAWRGRMGLVQNELVPATWEALGLDDPTVAIVWFERKGGRPPHVLRPTVLFGPGAPLLDRALGALDIPSRVADTYDDLVFSLVAKNLYILTVNCAGLRTRGTVRDLFEHHEALAETVAAEVLSIQEHLIGSPLDRPRLFADLRSAVDADPDHVCTGRSAPERLRRARAQARAAGLSVPMLDSLEELAR